MNNYKTSDQNTNKSLPTKDTILSKAKELSLCFEDETDDKYATIKITIKDFFLIIDFAKGDI